jgi:pyridoxamine 5'-phosphate oxidase
VPLHAADLPPDPYVLFERCYREAHDAGAVQPDAMTLATAGEGGPSARMVLFKGFDDGAFLFYTNYGSRKGLDIGYDRRAALVFYWAVTHHQVRIQGQVRKTNKAMSERYWATRPRGAQLSALASRQSSVVRSREQLERKVLELAARYPDAVPLPRRWGGYRLRPRWIEFWESREDRLHHRMRYTVKTTGAWRIERLAP